MPRARPFRRTRRRAPRRLRRRSHRDRRPPRIQKTLSYIRGQDPELFWLNKYGATDTEDKLPVDIHLKPVHHKDTEIQRKPSRQKSEDLSVSVPPWFQIEIKGLDIYDPIKDEVKSRDVHDIAYWMVDTDYDGANFIVRQAFFCGADKDEFDDWKKGLTNLATVKARTRAEKTLKIEIDEEAFARLYGHVSHPFLVKKVSRSRSASSASSAKRRLSRRDLDSTKERSSKYFEEVSTEFDTGDDDIAPELLVAPSRVYPVNHMNLSRIDEVGEISLYRYTMHTLLNTVRRPEKTGEKPTPKVAGEKATVPCYPVVMFRSDIRVQVALLKELFSS